MIKSVNDIPEAGRERKGKRVQELEDFVKSGNKIGMYQMQEGEKLMSIYHSFKVALRSSRLDEVLDVTVRRKEVYFIRRDM